MCENKLLFLVNHFCGSECASRPPLRVMKIDIVGEKWLRDGCIDKWLGQLL